MVADLKPSESAQFRPHLEDYVIRRYGPNEAVPTGVSALREDLASADAPTAKSGDFVLTHSAGLFGKLIRYGEAIRYRKEAVFAHWSHAAIFINDVGDLIEALSGGVQQRNISVYKETEYVVVHLPQTTIVDDRTHAVEFAEHCLNEPYGWLTIASIAIALLTATKLNIGIDGQQICSALVGRCLERIGEIFTENEPWHLMPADLAKHFNVTDVGDRGQIPARDTGVAAYSRPGKRKQSFHKSQ